MSVLTYVVPPEADGASVQAFLRRDCSLSWRMVVRLKQTPGGITADGAPARTIDKLSAGQTVRLTLPEDALRIEAIPMPLSICFEDEFLLVLNKPPYLAVHPSHGRPEPTLANGVVAHYAARGQEISFRPVNRLDRNTSGLLLAAKNSYAAFAMVRRPVKEYTAIVWGELTGEGVIDAPIRVREGSFITREVGEGGKESITHWQALATDGTVTLLRLWLETGRTHQIRVHMAYSGHPLVGDTLYGTTDALLPRHALHCGSMRFTHPVTGEELSFLAPLPEDMAGLLRGRGLPCE